MRIFDVHNSCENIKSFCKYRVYLDFDSYADRDPEGVEFSDTYEGLPWSVRHDYDIISFHVGMCGLEVDVLIDMEECEDE